MYFSTSYGFSPAPVQRQRASQPPQPAFSGSHHEKAIEDVMEKVYKIDKSFWRYGSEYTFTGREILERLDEACQERAKRRGASTLADIAAHPFIERDPGSMQVLEEGLQDLCHIGFAKQVRPGAYRITAAGDEYLHPYTSFSANG